MTEVATGRSREVLSFGAVGLAAYLVDVLVFNLLLLRTGTGSTTAKVVSSLVAIAVAFVGSRYVTWRHRRSDRMIREYLLFLGVSLLAAGVQLLCLLIARTVFDLRSPLADNVSANLVGMVLATVVRFFGFRLLVFPQRDGSGR